MQDTNDTRTVRPGEEIDVQAIEQFLRKNLSIPEGDLQVRQFGAGHSNLTYELSLGNWRAVLRRPPLGPVAPKAHDMEREYKILEALHPVFPLAPKPYLFDSGGVLGAPFFIMERRDGVVFDKEFPEGEEQSRDLGRRISESMVDRLVELHSIDYKKTALKYMVKPEGFMERQIHGWIKRYEKAETDDVVSGERLKKWLIAHVPHSNEAAVIHYDYKLNNAMFDPDDPAKMVGLFDWEMTTVGDPLADVGAALSYWIEAGDPELLKTGLGKPPVTVTEGFYTRKEFIERYAEKSGRSVDDIHVYLTFAYFKLAGIIQQIYYRYKQGQTNDPRFANMNVFVNNLIKHAEETAGI
ncbi:Predicted kinase, aminoglycoside phosphotransferase (APT) family [Halobacillus alkaliphilus]|uniref:Predicted kinase, aminoglycoside phosphotransferase (APT) family n=1 Tax=Halobacillus alkaliphilus TaxID=396056 RepID=A0A1I2SL53_9BACI|nr:phosphotransferase family protein [Halobacillus alkaliphilus]SFG50976.1 Predicted kinase, aminoglycoside phosphotransferase (APT) family [Halobacillus alkaliphilus]